MAASAECEIQGKLNREIETRDRDDSGMSEDDKNIVMSILLCPSIGTVTDSAIP